MVGEAIAGLSAVKTAFDMAKALKDIDNAVARNAAVIELQEKIFTAREAQTALLERINELEAKVVSFETWETEKERYELKDVGVGSLAYSIKEAMRGAEPTHAICPACFQHRKKSILQPDVKYMTKLLRCLECKAEIRAGLVDDIVVA